MQKLPSSSKSIILRQSQIGFSPLDMTRFGILNIDRKMKNAKKKEEAI